MHMFHATRPCHLLVGNPDHAVILPVIPERPLGELWNTFHALLVGEYGNVKMVLSKGVNIIEHNSTT